MKALSLAIALGLSLAGCASIFGPSPITHWETRELAKCGRDVACRRHIQTLAELKRVREAADDAAFEARRARDRARYAY